MTQASSAAHPVLILGGGRGGTAFLELLRDEALVQIIGVSDPDPAAPALATAKALNIPVYSNAEVALRACRPCTAFNLTGDESVSELAASIIGSCSIIGGSEAHLIWKIISQLRDTRDKLQSNRLLTESIVTHAMEGIILINTLGVIKAFNPAAERIFGYRLEEVIEKNISMLMPEPHQSEHDSYLQRYMQTKEAHVIGIERELIAKHKSGEPIHISLSVNEMTSGNEHYFVGIVADISERKRNEAAILKLAHFDANTGLPNRTLFFDRFTHALAQAKRYDQQVAILFLDLDGFKAVNDTLGHVAGDTLLQEVAARLLKAIREVDTVARFGGDEFAFILYDVTTDQHMTQVVTDRILAALASPFIINGIPFHIGGSIGISLFPENATDMDALIHQADTAMYAAKNSGKNRYLFYKPDMEPE